MRRGETWLADLEPMRGTEANKRRPVIVVSNDGANGRAATLQRGVVTVVPVTSNVTRILPFQLLLEPAGTGLTRPSKVQAEQVQSIDVTRLSRRLGAVSRSVMTEVDERLRLHLGL